MKSEHIFLFFLSIFNMYHHYLNEISILEFAIKGWVELPNIEGGLET